MTRVAIVRIEDGKVNEAIHEALTLIGGLDRVVKPNSKVLVKPNLCTISLPGSGVVTNYKVMEGTVKEVLNYGGMPIVAESSIGSSPSATEAALKAVNAFELERLGAKVLNLDEDEVIEVNLPRGRALRRIGIAKSVLECDVRISVPVLKYHPEATVTLGLKNMKGCLPGKNKIKTHEAGLHQAIADYNTVLRPDLVIIDGIVAGAWGKTVPRKLNLIVAGFDPVATDAVGAMLLRVNPNSIEHLVRCSEMGLGTINLNEIEIVGLSIQEALEFYLK